MIYVNENFMDINEEELKEDMFLKDGENYIYASQEVEDDMFGNNRFLCIKLIPEFKSKGKDVYSTKVEILSNTNLYSTERKTTEEEEREAYELFLGNLSQAYSINDVLLFEEFGDIVEKYIDEPYIDIDDNIISFEFMDTLLLTGKAYEGYYGGNVVLRNIQLINQETNQVIKEYEPTNIVSNLYFEEEDDSEYMIECLLENMSQYELQELMGRAIGREIN